MYEKLVVMEVLKMGVTIYIEVISVKFSTYPNVIPF